jgi:hypothetical protein
LSNDIIQNICEDVSVTTVGDESYIETLSEDLVRTTSVASILRELGEDYKDLIPLIKSLVSELVLALHTNTFVDGVIDELRSNIKLRLWEVGDEFSLAKLIDGIVMLGMMVREGVNDLDIAEEVMNDFVEFFSLDLNHCNVVRKVFSSGDLPLILQVMLIGLIIAVDGINYVGEEYV